MMLDPVFVCWAPPIAGSLLRHAAFNQMEEKDLSLIICSASLFNLTKRAPHVCYRMNLRYFIATLSADDGILK